MRKTISLVLVAAMLLATFMFVPTASAATLDEHNVQIDAQYFGGTVVYDETWGTFPNITWASVDDDGGYYMYDTIKEGDSSLGTLTIDGKIEEGEWTDKVYHIDSDYAPYSGLAYGNNSLFEAPSAENTFYRWLKDGNNKSLAPTDGLEFDVRFMWDEDYFYLAAVVIDTDGHINNKSANSGNNWDGDSIQFRLDPNGANAAVGGQGYDASVDSYPYDPEIHGEVDNTLNCTYPWTPGVRNNFGEETKSEIGNFMFSYAEQGYTDACDASKRYWPETITNEEGVEETIYTFANISYYETLGSEDPDKISYASVYVKDISEHPRFPKTETVYEIALPWTLVADGYEAEAGDELGFAMALFNAQKGKGDYNSYLAWGSGLTNYETKDMPQVCGGSNCLVLTTESYADAVNCEHTFAEPTCIDPETCTQCGYQRGFVAGHKNAFSSEAIPNGKGDGAIAAKCTICGEKFTKTLASNEAYVRWDFLETETTVQDQGWYPEGGFCIQWEDLDPEGSRYTDETDPTGELRVKWWNEDGTAKNSFDNKTFPGKNVLDLTSDGQVGTYFEANEYSTSYTEATEVYFTNLPLTSTVDSENPYNTFFGNWFGGDGTYGGGNGVYVLAGLVNVEDRWFFAIYPASHQNPQTVAELDEYAYSYTEATAEQIATETWHEYVFMFDNAAETAMLFWDNQLVASASDYHFPSTNTHAILLQHNAQSYITNIQIGSTGLAAALTDCIPEGTGAIEDGGDGDDTTETYTVTVDGVETEVKAGETIEISALAFEATGGRYFRFNEWTGDVADVADVTAATTTVVVNGNLTINSTKIQIGDVNGDGSLNSMDTNTMKRMVVGNLESVPAGDTNGDGKVQSIDANLLARMVGGSWFPNK